METLLVEVRGAEQPRSLGEGKGAQRQRRGVGDVGFWVEIGVYDPDRLAFAQARSEPDQPGRQRGGEARREPLRVVEDLAHDQPLGAG